MMTRWPAYCAVVISALVVLSSLVGILDPATYARETATWVAQGVGQDWANLLVVAPFLALAGVLALRGSRLATVLLGGGLIYVMYSFVLYSFAVHFNSLFLVYCATLGLAVFGLGGLAAEAIRKRHDGWFDDRAPRRLLGGYLLGSALLFAALWLSEDIPAILRGTPPASLADVGLATNPVRVLDLAIVLPAMAIAGIALLRGRAPWAAIMGTWMATFAVLMDVALVGMFLALRARGLPAGVGLIAVFGLFTAISLAVVVSFLSSMRHA